MIPPVPVPGGTGLGFRTNWVPGSEQRLRKDDRDNASAVIRGELKEPGRQTLDGPAGGRIRGCRPDDFSNFIDRHAERGVSVPDHDQVRRGRRIGAEPKGGGPGCRRGSGPFCIPRFPRRGRRRSGTGVGLGSEGFRESWRSRFREKRGPSLNVRTGSMPGIV